MRVLSPVRALRFWLYVLAVADDVFKNWFLLRKVSMLVFNSGLWFFCRIKTRNLSLRVSNQEAINIACPLCVDAEKPQPLLACSKLIELSVSRGSADDISVILIQLGRIF